MTNRRTPQDHPIRARTTKNSRHFSARKQAHSALLSLWLALKAIEEAKGPEVTFNKLGAIKYGGERGF